MKKSFKSTGHWTCAHKVFKEEYLMIVKKGVLGKHQTNSGYCGGLK